MITISRHLLWSLFWQGVTIGLLLGYIIMHFATLTLPMPI